MFDLRSHMPATPIHHRRAAWARRLDRLVEGALALGGLLPRPSDPELRALAHRDRPDPPVRVPELAELGLPDPLGEGRRAFAEGRYAEALFCFGQLLEAEPRHPWAWHGRGDALQLLGQHREALSAYTRAVELAPLVGIHRAGLSNALQALGQVAEAQAAWQQALRLDPSLTWMRPDAAR